VIGVVLLVAGHLLWFLVFGPPSRWGSGVEDHVPNFAGIGFTLAAPITLAPGNELPPRKSVDETEKRSGITGRILYFEEVPQYGYAVLQTYNGRYWSEDQHLYFRRASDDHWREISLPPPFIISNPELILQDGRVMALIERWDSWWPYRKNFSRYLLSIFQPELRAEYSLCLLDLERGRFRYLFPGHTVVLSPDRRFAAYTTSENGFSGFHTIRVLKVGQPKAEPVLSLWETDPGSGVSFTYKCTQDSQSLVIEGGTQGFTRFGSTHYRKIRFVYLLDCGLMVDLGDPKN
jgi:hypothetical protein